MRVADAGGGAEGPFVTRARKGALARSQSGAVDQDGKVITIPRLPSVAGANKPSDWNQWSVAEKVEHLLGLSLPVTVRAARYVVREIIPKGLAACQVKSCCD